MQDKLQNSYSYSLQFLLCGSPPMQFCNTLAKQSLSSLFAMFLTKWETKIYSKCFCGQKTPELCSYKVWVMWGAIQYRRMSFAWVSFTRIRLIWDEFSSSKIKLSKRNPIHKIDKYQQNSSNYYLSSPNPKYNPHLSQNDNESIHQGNIYIHEENYLASGINTDLCYLLHTWVT